VFPLIAAQCLKAGKAPVFLYWENPDLSHIKKEGDNFLMGEFFTECRETKVFHNAGILWTA